MMQCSGNNKSEKIHIRNVPKGCLQCSSAKYYLLIVFVNTICVAQKAFLAHPTAMKHLIDLTTLKNSIKRKKSASRAYNLLKHFPVNGTFLSAQARSAAPEVYS